MRGNYSRHLTSIVRTGLIVLFLGFFAAPLLASEPSWRDVPLHLKKGVGTARQGNYMFVTGAAEIPHIREDKAHEIAKKKSLLRALKMAHIASSSEKLLSTFDSNDQRQFVIYFAHLVSPVHLEGVTVIRQWEKKDIHYTTLAIPFSFFADSPPVFPDLETAITRYLKTDGAMLRGLAFCFRHVPRYSHLYLAVRGRIGRWYRDRGQSALAMCFLSDDTDVSVSPLQQLVFQNRLYRANQYAEMAEESALKDRWTGALNYASRAIELVPTCTGAYLVLADYFLREQKEPLFAMCAAEKGMRDGTRSDDAIRKAIAVKKMTGNPEEELYRYILDHQGSSGKNISLELVSPIAYLVLNSEGRAIEGKCQPPGGKFRQAALLFGKTETDEDVTTVLQTLFRACEERPRVIQTYNLIGACYRHLKKPEMAIPFFLQALSLNPEYDFALTNMGLCCQETGLMKSAEYYFEQEVVRKSTNVWVNGCYAKFHNKDK